MRIVMDLVGRRCLTMIAAAGMLALGSAQAAFAMAAPAPNASANASKPDADEIVDDGSGGDEGFPPARSGPTTASPGAFTRDDAVSATREGLSRSRVGAGLRQLRILDYILLAGVGVLLLLVIVLLILVAGLRSRIGTLAGPPVRDIGEQEADLYGAKPLP